MDPFVSSIVSFIIYGLILTGVFIDAPMNNRARLPGAWSKNENIHYGLGVSVIGTLYMSYTYPLSTNFHAII
jgi:hypothetical protein